MRFEFLARTIVNVTFSVVCPELSASATVRSCIETESQLRITACASGLKKPECRDMLEILFSSPPDSQQD
jgi:hypothetical protein